MPAEAGQHTPGGARLDSRNQARWLSHHRSARRQRRAAVTRNGYDFTARFPKIVDAVASLAVRSCVVDGEAVAVDERGVSVFDDLRYRLRDHAAVLCAFDLIELDGQDLRRARLEDRKDALADLLRGMEDGIAFNKHFDADGAIVFTHACVLGCEGIVSKRLGSPYRSGRVDHWLKRGLQRRFPEGENRVSVSLPLGSLFAFWQFPQKFSGFNLSPNMDVVLVQREPTLKFEIKVSTNLRTIPFVF